MAESTTERGEAGYPLEKPAEPATVAHTVRQGTTLGALAEQLGVALEDLLTHNGELLGGWRRHPRTGELSHVVEVPEGTIVHLPPGTEVPEPEADPAPTTSSTRSKGIA